MPVDSAVLVSSPVRSAGSLLARTDAHGTPSLHAADSAIYGVADFKLDFPITVDIGASVDDALKRMDRLGIQALVVVSNRLSEESRDVVGLVTAYAIERACHRRRSRSLVTDQLEGVSVGDVMTPWDHLSIVKYESLRSLTLNGVYEMFQGTGLTHLLVVETHGNDIMLVRGVLSRAAVAERLGRAPRVVIRPLAGR
jgi:CBS domain-containing protein